MRRPICVDELKKTWTKRRTDQLDPNPFKDLPSFTFVSGRFGPCVAFLRDKNEVWLSLDPVLPCSLKNT